MKTFVVKLRRAEEEQTFQGTHVNFEDGFTLICDNQAVVVSIPDKEIEYLNVGEDRPE